MWDALVLESMNEVFGLVIASIVLVVFGLLLVFAMVRKYHE